MKSSHNNVILKTKKQEVLMKKIAFLFVTMIVLLIGCSKDNYDDATKIVLSDSGIIVNEEVISTDSTAAVYTANDIVYYEADKGFTYGEGTSKDEHTAEEAISHSVIHITEPGRYLLSGKLSAGQVAIDLGEEAKDNPDAVVTLILDGVDINCSVAPAVIFYNVYECGDKDVENASYIVDTTAAGANVLIADDTINQVTGSYVARIYKPESVMLSEDGSEVEEAKKLSKKPTTNTVITQKSANELNSILFSMTEEQL